MPSGNLQTIKLLTVFFVATSTTLVSGGVILDLDGYVTSATLNDGTQDYSFNFVRSSYDSLTTAQQNAIKSGPQYSGIGDRSAADVFAVDLANELQSIGFPPGIQDALYGFAYRIILDNEGDVYDSIFVSYGIGWEPNYRFTGTSVSSDQIDRPIVLAVPTITSNSVPEPSSAIAMGLLGIVGFAGNRRRRRQGSVA